LFLSSCCSQPFWPEKQWVSQGSSLSSSLEFLSLTNNQFTGSIVAIGNLSKFKYLDLSFN
jgi:Leucine-rich repeat (LRR) protein